MGRPQSSERSFGGGYITQRVLTQGCLRQYSGPAHQIDSHLVPHRRSDQPPSTQRVNTPDVASPTEQRRLEIGIVVRQVLFGVPVAKLRRSRLPVR